MRKILFYGDSNTYGYDPRGFLGMRYPEEIRWTTKVKAYFDGKYEIVEEGQNGRCLPSLPREEAYLKRILDPLSTEDIFIIMLGTNDILLTDHPDADTAIRKMDDLTDWLISRNPHLYIIVIGPVPVSNTSGDMQIYNEESIRMNVGFEEICKNKRIPFFNAAYWNIELAYDGVHFSEIGCKQFAVRIIEIIAGL